MKLYLNAKNYTVAKLNFSTDTEMVLVLYRLIPKYFDVCLLSSIEQYRLAADPVERSLLSVRKSILQFDSALPQAPEIFHL